MTSRSFRKYQHAAKPNKPTGSSSATPAARGSLCAKMLLYSLLTVARAKSMNQDFPQSTGDVSDSDLECPKNHLLIAPPCLELLDLFRDPAQCLINLRAQGRYETTSGFYSQRQILKSQTNLQPQPLVKSKICVARDVTISISIPCSTFNDGHGRGPSKSCKIHRGLVQLMVPVHLDSTSVDRA